MTLLEAAYLLGFADPSNFFRAFRRWFDLTPGEYRTRMELARSAGPEASAQGVSVARTPACTEPAP